MSLFGNKGDAPYIFVSNQITVCVYWYPLSEEVHRAIKSIAMKSIDTDGTSV